MKRFFLMTVAALCLGSALVSCKKDNDHKGDNAKIEDLGGGIYKINGARFVDLGLPSGLLWAECNVGASSETEKGNRFAWGETEEKDSYTPENYKFGTDESNFTKYCEKDGKKTLEAADDAATVKFGAPCRTPLLDEFKELLNTSNTTSTWTTRTASDGKTVKGYEIKSNKNGNAIFFPALRYVSSGKDQAEYWCADLYEYVPFSYDLASHYLFNEISGLIGKGGVTRYNSAEVRPVASISK